MYPAGGVKFAQIPKKYPNANSNLGVDNLETVLDFGDYIGNLA